MMRRGLELAAGVDWWTTQAKGRLLFPTLTARHHAGHRLPDVLGAVIDGWHAVASGRAWKRDADALDLLGSARSLEVLHNQRNGWHPHNHVLMFVGEHVDQAAATKFERGMVERWSRALERKGFDSLPVGQRVELITKENAGEALARYLVKSPGTNRSTGQALGYEMTAAQSKSGRSVGRTQWQLAASAVDGNAPDRLNWNNFESATFRKRQLNWSRGLREALRLGVEQSDEDIAAEVLGTEADTVGSITADGWTEMLKHPGLPATLLTMLEKHGWERVTLVLNGFGIEYHTREALSYE